MFDLVGQARIKLELESIARNLRADRMLAVNLLLRGPAGSGKTLFAEQFLVAVFGNQFSRQFPSQENGFQFWFTENIRHLRGHFVDEVHALKNPEALYPLMDSRRYVFVLATNEGGQLPEALTSRCFVYALDDYTEAEIAQIVINYGKEINFQVTLDTALLIASRARLSPRIAKQYLSRIRLIVAGGYYPKTLRGINAAFKDIGILDGGYTTWDIKYLQYLSKVGRSSLDNLARALKLDKATIQNEIEPFLLMHDHILITPRGRMFKHWEAK